MDENVRLRLEILELLAKGDEQYSQMHQEMYALEKKYDTVLTDISTEQMDIICDFVSQCETMSQRMLELACTYMRFPG